MTKEGKARLWPEGKGGGAQEREPRSSAQLPRFAKQAVGSPGRDLEVSTESVVGLPEPGALTQLSRHHEASYLQGQMVLDRNSKYTE